MAVGTVNFGDPIETEQWGKMTERETLTGILGGMLIGKGESAACKLKEDLAKDPKGLTLTITYNNVPKVAPLKAGPLTGNRYTTEGNENQIEYFNDQLQLGLEEFPFRQEVVFTDQQILDDFRATMKSNATDRWTEYLDESYMNVLAGNTAAQGGADGNNTIALPSDNNWIFGGAGNTDEDGLAAGDNMTLDLLSDAVERAETLRTEFDQPALSQATLPVGTGFGAILSKRAYKHLMKQASTAGQLLDIQKAAMQGGQVGDENIIRSRYKNQRYQYHGMIDLVHIFTSPYVPKGQVVSTGAVNTSVDRNIFFGRQAAWIGYGRNSSNGRFRWVEQEFDYEKEYGITARLMWGIKKARVESFHDIGPVDLGVIAISTHRDLV